MGRDSRDRVVRYTRGRLSIELTLLAIGLTYAFRFATWGFRRTKPVLYHPTALLSILAFLVFWIISPWLFLAPVLAMFGWFVGWPDSYLRHVQPRAQSFLAGFRYRWRPRPKLTRCSILRADDPIPTISHVRKIGCVNKVRVKMCWGHSIDWWREDATRLAQTYNALDCKINPYRRETLIPWRHEMVTKPRWLELEFLTKDPFSTGLGVEYINYHKAETLSPVVATYRTGEPHTDNLAAHRLRVAMTRWGKSNAIRATIYAHRHNLAAGLLEIWLIDGKGGVEGAFLEHQVARHAYGDVEADPNTYDPAEFDELLQDAVTVLMRRQKKMRGFATEHTPTHADPWLRIKIDEVLVLTSKNVPSDMRNRIAANVNLIQQQGVACGVTLDASTQLGKKDKLDPIDRDGFTEFEIGRTEPGVVDMIFGTGWYERGARCDEIPKDLKGVFYRKTDTTMAPVEIRYPMVTVADLNTMPPVGESVLWVKPPVPDLGFA